MKGEPSQHTFKGTGAQIVYFEWGDPTGQPVLLLHATGFHARCWDKVVALLPDRFRVIAPDTRGHGRSERTGHISDWTLSAGDVRELVVKLDLENAIGVGHSKGGHTMVQVAGAMPARFERLVLVDPVTRLPGQYPELQVHMSPADHPVARRRNSWRSWEEMFAHFRDRHPYSLWEPGVLEDYCRHGLAPKPDGDGFELACPPEIEASIYLGIANVDLTEIAKNIRVPVTVLRAKDRSSDDEKMDFASSPTWPGLAAAFPDGRDVYLPHLTHFMPMQDPGLVARFVVDADAKANSE